MPEVVGHTEDVATWMNVVETRLRALEAGQRVSQAMIYPMISAAGGGHFTAGSWPVNFTTSSSYVELYRADFWSVGGFLSLDAYVVVGSGCTVDYRAACYEFGGTPTYIYTATGVTASQQDSQINMSIPTAGLRSGTGEDFRGRFMTVRMELKLTAGSNDCSYAPIMCSNNLTAVFQDHH